jgi:FixJ family two-component response regulator
MTAEYEQVVIGRIYNRTKKPQGGTGANQHKQKVQNELSATTAKKIADEYGMNEKTVVTKCHNGVKKVEAEERAKLSDICQSFSA